MFRPVKIRHYVAFMEARGYAAREVLVGSGLDAEQLQAPACLVDLHQYQAVVSNMIRLTGNQGIGFEVGAETDIADFGIVGHAMMSSRTARDALALWLRYSNSLVGTLLTMDLHEHAPGQWSLTIAELRPMGFVYNFVVEEILMIARMMGHALTKKPFIPGVVELSYPAPAHQALYPQYLLCEARFTAGTPGSASTRSTSICRCAASTRSSTRSVCSTAIRSCGRSPTTAPPRRGSAACC